MSTSFDNIKSAVRAAADTLGVTEYEIYYTEGEELSVETLGSEISSFSSGASRGLCLRVGYEGKMGYASSELVSEEEIRALFVRALENASATEKEDDVGIFSGGESYKLLSCTPYAPYSASRLKEIALSISDAMYSHSGNVKEGSTASALSSGYAVRLYNSHGLSLECSGGVNAVTAGAVIETDKGAESAYEVRLLDSNTDPRDVAVYAVDTALSKTGADFVASGKYDIIIDSRRMRSLLAAFSSVFSARAAQMGMSLLRGKVGERIASEAVTITDDPMRDGVPVITNFDAEGVPACRKTVVERGILKTLLHNRETAKKDGVKSTGNASKSGYSAPISVSPYAFCIEAGEYSFAGLLSLLGEGILITDIKGLHAGASAVTGDFSLECAGFGVSGGRKGGALKSFTIAGNFFELLKAVEALSDRVELGVSGSFTVFGSPDVLVRGVTVSGK